MYTVGDMLNKYERERVPLLAARTRKDYSRHIKGLREVFGDKDVRLVTRQEIKDFAKVAKGKEQRLKMIAVLRAAFTEALMWNWVDGNPCTHMERNTPRRRDPPLSLQEFQSAISLLSKRRAGIKTALVLELALHTGQQQADVLGLRWSQVDNQTGTILFRDTRTKKKVPVHITPEIQELLDRAKKICGGFEYVVTTKQGHRYTGEGFRAMWQRFLRKYWDKTGNDRFDFHDIRELHRSNCAAMKGVIAPDPVDEYPQFEQVFKDQAMQMAPYYKVFFCLEQSIRRLVTNVLENAVGSDWWESDRITPNMRQEVNALLTREVDSATTQRSLRMIDYTTFGQLGVIIRDNWDLFERHFVSKGAVSAAISRLNLTRGPIAHCCVMSKLEIERLGLSVRDWYNILKKV